MTLNTEGKKGREVIRGQEGKEGWKEKVKKENDEVDFIE